MVGNDIVDLRDGDSDLESYRDGFDARVFTESEQAQITSAPDPARERWRLWAAKEATYKLARQLDSHAVFAKREFEVRADPGAERGVVTHDGRRFFVSFDETPDRIHAIAVIDEAELSLVVARVERLDEGGTPDESTAVRSLACDTVAEHFSLPRPSLEIRKADRIPKLFSGNRSAGLDVSLSHHGAWIAFACHEGETRVA